MNILFLTMLRINSFSDTNIYMDLMNEFIAQGHRVTIICPLERKYGTEQICVENKQNRIIQVPTGNLFQTNVIEKGISTLLLENSFIKGIKKNIGSEPVDLILYSTPPITFAKPIEYVKKNNGAKSYLLLKDIFPQNAVDLHMFGKVSPIYQFFRKKEKKLYQLSDYIGCMSDANCKYVLEHNKNIPQDIVEVCPNTMTLGNDISNSKEKIEEYKEQLKDMLQIPKDAVLFLYGGNFGKPQGADYIMECLEYYKGRQDICFLLCGKGTEYEKLDRWINTEQMQHVKLLPWMEKEHYDILTQCCDAGLVFLNKDFTIPNFPSRILSYMEAGIPILAATDKNTDVGDVICQNGFGVWCESSSVDNFVREADKLLKDKELRQTMGARGRQFLEQNWTSSHAYKIIMKHFE